MKVYEQGAKKNSFLNTGKEKISNLHIKKSMAITQYQEYVFLRAQEIQSTAWGVERWF